MNLLEEYINEGIIELDFLFNQFLEICHEKGISFEDLISAEIDDDYPYIWCNVSRNKVDFCSEYEKEGFGIFRTFAPTTQILKKDGGISLRINGNNPPPVYKYLKFDQDELGEPTDRFEIELRDNNIDLFKINEPMNGSYMRYSSSGQMRKNGVTNFTFEPLSLIEDDERIKTLNEIASILNKTLSTMYRILSKYEFEIPEANLEMYEDCSVFTLKR